MAATPKTTSPRKGYLSLGVAGPTTFNNLPGILGCDQEVLPNTLYLDLGYPVKRDILLSGCVWNVGAVSTTSVRVEIWRRLPNNQLVNVFTDSTWVPASKLGVTGSRFRFCAKAGDLIGFRCTEANPIAYGTFTNKKGKTLV